MSNQSIPSDSDEISINKIVSRLNYWYKYLLTKAKFILVACIIGGILGFCYSYFRKPNYTALCTFVLEESESSGGLGQYAGLASMVGIDLGGNGGGIFKGDNILQLYKSRKMIEETLLTIYTFNNKKERLINRYIKYNELDKKLNSQPETKNLDFNLDVSKFTIKHDSILGKVIETINEKHLGVAKPDKKLSIIQVTFQSKDQLFAKAFTETIVKNVNQFYADTKTKKSSENIAVLQKQADSVKAVLNNSIGGVASAIDANPNVNPAFLRLRVPSQRKQVDVQASSVIYSEIVKNLEIAKITFRREKPLIQIIDEPKLPLKDDRIGLSLSLILGVCIGGIISVLLLVSKKALGSN